MGKVVRKERPEQISAFFTDRASIVQIKDSLENTHIDSSESAPQNAQLLRQNIDGELGAPRYSPRECLTCCEELPADRFPIISHTEEPEHDAEFCVDCWNKHLLVEIRDKSWDKVCCVQCRERLDEAQIRKLAAPSSHSEWLDKAAKAWYESCEDYRSCPVAECNWGCLFSPKADGNIFICELCKYRYCVSCEVPMHEDETCDEYKQRIRTQERKRLQDKENKASEDKVGEISKPCPDCTARLEKDDGCDHVTYLKCDLEFCWQCFAEYDGPTGIRGARGNDAHASDCPYHPSKLPTLDPQDVEGMASNEEDVSDDEKDMGRDENDIGSDEDETSSDEEDMSSDEKEVSSDKK